MKTNEEITKWLLENAVNKNGDLDLRGIDLSKFEGNVYITKLKVKKDLFMSDCEVGGNLYQNFQKVNGDLLQDNQVVKGDLWQDVQNVKGDLWQEDQEVEGDLISHKLEKFETWKDNYFYVKRIKFQPITKDELAKMGYVLKD